MYIMPLGIFLVHVMATCVHVMATCGASLMEFSFLMLLPAEGRSGVYRVSP